MFNSWEKTIIEIILTKSDIKGEYVPIIEEVFYIDLNTVSQNIDYGKEAIGGEFI